ncbi:MAG: hypothetical protein ACOX1F_00185 [Erysipelotrichaceae bacterium]
MFKELIRIINVSTKQEVSSKLFGISFSVFCGELVCIAGRTYSGHKSLINILIKKSDYYGSIIINPEKKELKQFNDQIESGIFQINGKDVVYVNFSIIDIISFSKYRINLLKKISNFEIEQEIIQVLKKYNVFDVVEKNYSELLKNLPAFQRNIFKLVRCIVLNAKIIILSDFFYLCSDEEILILLEMIKKMINNGYSFIYVYDEYFEIIEGLISRLITFRNGLISYIFWNENGEFNREKLFIAINGEKIVNAISRYKKVTKYPNELLVKIIKNDGNLAIEIKKGEIVGLSDHYFINVESMDDFICLIKEDYSLKMDEYIEINSIKDLINAGVAVVSRNNSDIFYNLSPVENVTLISEKLINPIIHSESVSKHLFNYLTTKYLFLNSLNKIIDKKNSYHLSEEEIEKIIMAKWLSINPKFLIYFAINSIIQTKEQEEMKVLFNQLKEEGKSVLVISASHAYLSNVCDRLVIF